MTRTKRAGSPPVGLEYFSEFLSNEEEHALLGHLAPLDYHDVVVRGGYRAKRKTIHFGWSYGYSTWQIERADPIPEWLLPLRERIASAMKIEGESLEEVLVSFYPAGSGIGWHREAPMFGPAVAGVSLLSDCVMSFRLKSDDTFLRWQQTLAARSMYVLRGEVRARWQHSITATSHDRYSVTFRSLQR